MPLEISDHNDMPDHVAPRVFVSYSWSSPEYSERVLSFASQLVADGVDVVLDQWNLREGQDAYAFMEQSVTDPAVSRVLILCDPKYCEKADGRAGGVGTETTIISPEVYREVAQTKFVPVIMEREESGELPLPAYLRSRIYIDLSDPEREGDQYDRLLRVIFGKPEVERPPLGSPPVFLSEESTRLVTGRALAQYKEFVLRDRPQQTGYLESYLNKLGEAYSMEVLTNGATSQELLDKTLSSIEHFTPYRDEYIDCIDFIGRFGHGVQPFDSLHRFFERAIATRLRRSTIPYQHELVTENLSFLIRELALYTVGILLRAEKFEGLGRILSPFHVSTEFSVGGTMRGVEALDPPFPQLSRDPRDQNPISRLLNSRRNELLTSTGMLDAEIFLAIHSRLSEPTGTVSFTRSNLWFPRGIGWDWTFADSQLLVRLGEPSFQLRVLPALGIASISDLRSRVSALSDDGFGGDQLRVLRSSSLTEILRLN